MAVAAGPRDCAEPTPPAECLRPRSSGISVDCKLCKIPRGDSAIRHRTAPDGAVACVTRIRSKEHALIPPKGDGAPLYASQ